MDNTYLKLKTKETLNVAYFGGSVTVGQGSTQNAVPGGDWFAYSWRALTTDWLEQEYGVDVNPVNGAIGGTGTKYGAYRAVEHLKLESITPDLVFIDFAINDVYDGLNEEDTVAQSSRNLETIINTIYKYAPQADIVIVLTGDHDTMSGKIDFRTRDAHIAVAEAYGIPTIDVATPLWNKMCEENGGAPGTGSAVWKTYITDIVHPTDAGYAEYANTVQTFLKDTFDAKDSVPTGVVKAYTPAETLNTLIKNAHIDNFAGCTVEAGMTIKTASGSITDPIGKLTSTTDNATVSFNFTGTDLKLWVYTHTATDVGTTVTTTGTTKDVDDPVTITVDVDGVSDDFIITSTGVANHKLLDVISGLSNTEHAVTITLNANNAGNAALDLRYICVSGGDSMSGISNVK